jgi:DNA-binding PadR family transcriptional regulator
MFHRHFHEWGHGSECGSRHRDRHGHSYGRFAGGFGDDSEMGSRSFRTGRKLSGTDLQLVILALIAEKPSHGYEIIKALEERSRGFYTPSPGVIYPALTYLEEIGHATVTVDGSRKLYSPTEAGLSYLRDRRAIVDAILVEIARAGEKMEYWRRSYSGHDWRSPEYEAARHLLRAALEAKRHASPEEQRRIAEILARAAREVGGI